MLRFWMPCLLAAGFAVPATAQSNRVATPDKKADIGKPAPIDLGRAKEYFEEARRLAEADGGKLWGRSLEGPMLFVDPRSRFAVANQADALGKLKSVDGVFTATVPQNLPLANTAVRWSGTHWSMVLWPLPGNKPTRSVMLMHECWHRIQADLGLPSKDPINAQLDTLDGRYWLQLEWRALARALALSGVDQRQAIEDAVLFRQYRRGRFKESARAENALELHEGLAEYTGVKLSGLTAAEQRRLLLEYFERYPVLFGTFVRSFAYLSGPAYGLLLDQHAPGWLRKLKPGDDAGQLLAAALELKLATQDKGRLEERASRYEGPRLRAAEVAREEARVKKVAGFRQLLVDGPVLVLPLGKQQMSFNPSEIVPIEGIGTVYPTLTLISTWGKLQVHNASLIAADSKKAVVAAPFKSEAAKLTGDGWELQLEPGWKAMEGERKGDWTLKKQN